ncbi:MAG: SAM-dependent methyltransferase [Lactobacillus johnsonii]|nr:SAM-dependent methyltransferase [Lactobacillus johnsonii]
MAKSVEEKVEEYYKGYLDRLGVEHYGKTEGINDEINAALKAAPSKTGGVGSNYPDIQLLLEDSHTRRIPVMIEAKGRKGKLEKLDRNGKIVQVTKWTSDSKPGASDPHKKGDANYSVIRDYGVNGALHYGKAVLDGTDYNEVLIIGINGTTLRNSTLVDPEQKAYFVSKKNKYIPKHVPDLDKSWDLFKQSNIDHLFEILDELSLTEDEIEKIKNDTESELETRIQKIHQAIYDGLIKTTLNTNEKLYLFTGLIMAGLETKGAPRLKTDDLHSSTIVNLNDGSIILSHIPAFLSARKIDQSKIDMIIGLLKPIFTKKELNIPRNGESILKILYRQISKDIIPLLESNLHLDFTGKILNSLSDWVSIDNDKRNDVVLTPRYITNMMAKLARTNKDSYVWDLAMGSGGFLISAMELMINDAKNTIQDRTKLEKKIESIKTQQILGIEVLGNIYILAVLNMILMGDGSSNLINGNSHELYDKEYDDKKFPANVFLLNPPYSAPGKGFNFVKEALSKMTHGYAAILIKETAGSGEGLPYTKDILENNTLIASIHMPADVFSRRASVQVAIYLFKVGVPHEKDDMVTFINMSEDGYTRQNRKKSSQKVNLRDTDHAKERYKEVEAIILGKKPETSFYTKENKNVIKDTISLDGDDWTFAQHQNIDTTPKEEDFKKVVAEYLDWKVTRLIKDGNKNDRI